MSSEKNYDLRNADDVVEFMSEATTRADWDERVDHVMRVNRGYPWFWGERIVASGLARQIGQRWNQE